MYLYYFKDKTVAIVKILYKFYLKVISRQNKNFNWNLHFIILIVQKMDFAKIILKHRDILILDIIQ